MKLKSFIVVTVRVILLAGLVGLSGFAIHKMRQPESCTQNPQCQGCNQQNECKLPQKNIITGNE